MGESTSGPSVSDRLNLIEALLGHRLADAALLTKACTHASRCGAQATPAQRLSEANERLEFLGDAVLGAAICDHLFRRFPEASEGALSRRKAQLASRTVLAKVADETALLSVCLVGAQMSHPWPESVKANLVEAVLGAIHLDGGWLPLLTAVNRLFGALLDVPVRTTPDDAKTALQEWCLANRNGLPTYACGRSGGSDHHPVFTATVSIGDHQAKGDGGSRRRAEAVAAAELLRVLEVPEDLIPPVI